MPQPGVCYLCSRPDHEAIDAALAAGEPRRRLARSLGLPESTLRVHDRRCRQARGARKVAEALPSDPTPPAAALVMPEVPEAHGAGDELSVAALRELRSIHDTALEAYGSAQAAGDSRTVALLSPQLRANLVARLKIAEKLTPTRTPAERLLAHPDFEGAIRVVVEALDPHPEALNAVVVALERLLGETLHAEATSEGAVP